MKEKYIENNKINWENFTTNEAIKDILKDIIRATPLSGSGKQNMDGHELKKIIENKIKESGFPNDIAIAIYSFKDGFRPINVVTASPVNARLLSFDMYL